MQPNEWDEKRKPKRRDAFAARETRDGPWCWQSKEIMNRIDEVFDATNNVASARSVYVALTQIASDEQSESFTRPISEIARRAAVGYKTAAKILARFETLGILRVERNLVEGTREQAPSSYTLGNHYPTLGNGRNQPSLPRVQKNRERIGKKDKRARLSATSSTSANAPALRGFYESADFLTLTEAERETIEAYNRILATIGWLPLNKVTPSVTKALAYYSPELWLECFTSVAEEPRSKWPARLTFATLARDAY